MLYQKVFSAERYMDEQEVWNDENDGELDDDAREFIVDKRIKTERKARQHFLEDCCPDPLELSQLQVVVRFLVRLIRESLNSHQHVPWPCEYIPFILMGTLY